MTHAEFDDFAAEYDRQHRENIAITGEDPAYFAQYKIIRLAELVAEHGVRADAIIDFGSGIGNSIPHFQRSFPDAALTCADVSAGSLALAETYFPAAATSLLIGQDRIPAEDARFDIAFSACVLHHIPHEQHVAWLRELRRVTRPGGMIAVFEHNPLNPLTVRAVRSCPFDENARLLRAGMLAGRMRDAGWPDPATRYHIFFPRALARLRRWERHLESVPFGAQYSVTAIKKG